jgi:sugar lactone lactonase YvrE
MTRMVTRKALSSLVVMEKEGIAINSTPNSLFVDAQSTLYVSDYENHRVMKWMKGAKEGIVVAGGNGRGADVTQLDCPQGVWVDGCENVYVADWGNNRVIRWEKGAKRGTVIVGGNGEGERANQLSGPDGLFFDRLGHLYVADSGNHRVQRFSLC